ncbi:MAG: hypothetical protein HKN77_05655 [Woeseiaceae bacterium]|nr:hypothetical protein [Woeseiaceae bacterium]
MKLRIRDNSVRLRLTQGEVEALAKDGLIAATTAFPDGRDFKYQVESSPASVKPEANFTASVISVRLPESTVLAWATSSQVSIAGKQQLDDGQLLELLVEKDFACLAPREGEDESDMFVNPGGGAC